MSKTTSTPDPAAPTTSLEVRERLVEALKLDLVGPWAGHALAEERLQGWTRPSTWYLTGFLIPSGTPPEHSADPDENDDFGDLPQPPGLAEESAEEQRAAKKGWFPSSMGLSFLVSRAARTLAVVVRWGDYAPGEVAGRDGKPIPVWQRTPREETLELALDGRAQPVTRDVPASDGLQLHLVEREVAADDLQDHIPPGTRSVSVFLVNRRQPLDDERDRAFAFQAELEVSGDEPFVPRPDPRGAMARDWDEEVADLHYDDTPAYATGHGVSGEWEITGGDCRVLRTAWIPSAEVEKTETADIPGVELSMDALGALADGPAAEAALSPLVAEYRAWIEKQSGKLDGLNDPRRETARQLLSNAGFAAGRIEHGIAALAADQDALDAFRVANRAVARALKKRLGIESPEWHAFQLAFILLNLPGLADPRDPQRDTVDLLFFPTGGG